MSEEDDPLARDGNWSLLQVSGDARAMEQRGPNLEVTIAAVTERGETLQQYAVGGLIDTGSPVSCISPRLAPKLNGGVASVRDVMHPDGQIKGEPTIRCLLRFANGTEFERDFSVWKVLELDEVLIGRDILRECRMYIDIGKGHFRLYFANQTQD